MLSERIAKASNIGFVVTDFEDLIGSVDAILLPEMIQKTFKICKTISQSGFANLY